ncbi:MAG: FG-GAP-like repeat-containing protein, partial [Candidatus Parabeggiatoa sp.]|nr:FG-GAP-like repeat-containing protein [Candidatus Parabeggiatoa sp.]
MMLSKIFNALLILLFIWAGSIQANEPFATRLTPRIIIANEFNELLIRDVEGNLINRIAINTLGNDINNIAAGDFDGGSDDIVVHVNDQVNDQVLFYQLNGTAGALYSVEPASDIAVGNIDSDDLTEFFITDAMSHRVFVYDHDAKPITNFNINGLDDNTSLSIATADINNDGVVEIIVGDLLTEDKVAIYDLNGTEITTFSVFESSNTRSRRAIRKPGEQGKACEKGNASFCDKSTPSTPPPSDDTDSSAPPPSNDTGSSAPSSSDKSGSSSPPPSDDTADTGSSTPPPSDDTDSSTPPSSDNTDTSTSDSSDNTGSSSASSDNTDNSTSETGSSVSSSDETPTTSPTQPATPPKPPTQAVTQPTLPTQPATPPIQPTQPSQPVTPEPIPEAPLPIPHGAKVATGDLDGDGIPEIIVGMASNGGKVEIYTDQGEKISQFDTAFEKGVEITAGDVNQDGIDEIIVGDANGMTIQIFDLNGELINDFQGSDNGNIASLAFGKEALEATVPLESPTTNTESSATIPTDQSSATTPNEQSSETTPNDQSSETTPNDHSSETSSNEQSSETTSNDQSSETTADSSTADSSESTTVVSLPIVSLPPTTGSINQTGNYNGQTVTDAVIESDTSIANVKLAGEITNQGLLSNATILPGATLTGGTLTGYVDNQGTIADTQFVGATLSGGDLDGEITITSDPDKGLGILKAVTILPNAIVTGGALSGEILNHGTLSDITVNSDAIVTGGTVQGPIDNAGSLQNIILGEDTYIKGGDLSGTVAGNSNDIALIENATIHDADLSYVQISEGTQLGPNVVIGTGVIFDNNALIPSGSDLSLVLVSEFDEAGSLAINLDADVLAETKVYQETDNPTLLKQINSLPKIKDNDWQLVQNPENGQIELTIEGVHFVLIPVQVTQVSASQPAGFTVYDDNSVSFVTGYGREIFAQPVIQNKKALLEALAEISDEIIVQDDGTFKVKINDEWKTYRVSLSSEPVNSDDALGLFENADGSIRLVFEDNSGQKRQQQIYPLQEAGTEAEAQENFSGCEIDNYAQNTSTFAPRMKSGRVAPGQAKKIAHDEAELDVGANAVDGPTRLCIKSLYSLEIQELDPGMTNVTKGPRKGYRFFPKGMKFKNKVKVTVPYSKSLIPTGHTEDDIKTFYFDRELGKWQELERVELDSKANNVISYTDHFTDMINSVVTVPESPQSVSFNPTQIKDIKAADPGAGINLIEVPQANNMGDMRLSYPIEIPPGRVGMQPQLGVSYSSAGGNGWMGLNWSLS